MSGLVETTKRKRRIRENLTCASIVFLIGSILPLSTVLMYGVMYGVESSNLQTNCTALEYWAKVEICNGDFTGQFNSDSWGNQYPVSGYVRFRFVNRKGNYDTWGMLTRCGYSPEKLRKTLAEMYPLNHPMFCTWTGQELQINNYTTKKDYEANLYINFMILMVSAGLSAGFFLIGMVLTVISCRYKDPYGSLINME